MGFSALSPKQHFNLLNGALRNPTSQENSESDADINVKETDRRMVAKNSKGTMFSWFGGPPGSPSMQESDSSIDTHENIKSVDEDIELAPLSSNMHSSENLIPEEYSENHPDTIFKQATRVLKNTVLHDARNLGGHTERLPGWEANSAHEAKVRSSSQKKTTLHFPFSIWRVRSTSDSKTEEGYG